MKIKISKIPGGITRNLQHLDASIYKRFKDELKMRYTKYWMDQQEVKVKLTQEDKINWSPKFGMMTKCLWYH